MSIPIGISSDEARDKMLALAAKLTSVGPVTRVYPEDVRALGRAAPRFGDERPHPVPRGVWSGG